MEKIALLLFQATPAKLGPVPMKIIGPQFTRYCRRRPVPVAIGLARLSRSSYDNDAQRTERLEDVGLGQDPVSLLNMV